MQKQTTESLKRRCCCHSKAIVAGDKSLSLHEQNFIIYRYPSRRLTILEYNWENEEKLMSLKAYSRSFTMSMWKSTLDGGHSSAWVFCNPSARATTLLNSHFLFLYMCSQRKEDHGDGNSWRCAHCLRKKPVDLA